MHVRNVQERFMEIFKVAKTLRAPLLSEIL